MECLSKNQIIQISFKNMLKQTKILVTEHAETHHVSSYDDMQPSF